MGCATIEARLRSFAESARALGVTVADIHPENVAPHVASSLADCADSLTARWFSYPFRDAEGWLEFELDGFKFRLHSQPEPKSSAA